ncbi:DNA polymerase IV [hydrothermal vent metagenome]|uniref:DNA-directed DNA polymerase n=1 Tax=hydrothermal vent metagenome TaxID=652676 RepID=A0A3B0TKE4_9ZZZZ
MSSKDPEPAAAGPVQFVPGNCRDCGAAAGGGNRCPACRSPRLARHDEIGCLEIAHLDCDAFFASVEKRDRPELTDQPVIIGGGRRGVVSTACYIARIHGIHSAMPMFKALKACPEAVVIKPDMEKYVTESRRIRRLMQALTPLVEPVSIDEAFLDLSGTEALHGMTPAVSMINLARRIEVEIGITVSVGLSHNKFLAKLASDLDKPRGFSVIGREETLDFLSPRKVTDIWGVGAVTGRQLAAAGLKTMGDLQSADPKWLRARFGKLGARLASLACGRDNRRVTPKRPAKSISAETTFAHDITDPRALEVRLWRLCEQVASRAKAGGHHGATAVLKLKTTDFRTRTRNCRFAKPTQLADDLFGAVKPLLAKEVDKGLTKGGDGTAFRLIGVGFTDLDHPAAQGCPPADFFATGAQRRAKVERTLDDLKKRFGDKVIGKGRAWE